jgi:hypothetical protein
MVPSQEATFPVIDRIQMELTTYVHKNIRKMNSSNIKKRGGITYKSTSMSSNTEQREARSSNSIYYTENNNIKQLLQIHNIC